MGGGAVCVTVVDEASSAGGPPATLTMMVNMWGIKKSRDILFLWGNQEQAPGGGGAIRSLWGCNRGGQF